jgi:hypothetical protein
MWKWISQIILWLYKCLLNVTGTEMSYLYRVYMDCIHTIMIVSESSQSLPNQEGRPGRDRMHSVSITTDVVGSTPTQGEVYNIMW